MLVLAVLTMCSALAFGQGLTVSTVGVGNCHVRIDPSFRYVLLPIEDDAPEVHVRLVADGKLQTYANMRLAVGKVDYMVPLDLQPWLGSNIVLDVRKDGSNEEKQLFVQGAWGKSISATNSFDTTNRETLWRPHYHHTPQYAWMNDPNGMFYLDGQWHLCYQWGPYGSTWNNMTWGHSVSSDLVHWRALEPALRPDGLGTIFSGSAVVDSLDSAGFGKDAIIAMYTQADRSQFQSMAYSTDGGKTFTPYAQNPVLTQDYEFRDPHMFYHEPTHKWIAIVASPLNYEMEIYSSCNLKTWERESSFGKGYGVQDVQWECPDLMELPIRGEQGTAWVVICNVNPGGLFGGSATQYFTGQFNGKTFVCDTPKEVTKWLDYGKDHYAAVSWNSAPDDRHTMIAWMSNWQYANQVPTKQYRSANTLPRDVELYRAADGQLYIASKPSPEVDMAREKVQNLGTLTKGKQKEIPQDCLGACEIDLDVTTPKNAPVTITLANGLDEKILITIDTGRGILSMDRSQSGQTAFSSDFCTITSAPLPGGKTLSLRLFLDSSSIEVFEKEGRFAMTNLVFPSEPYSTIAIDGGRAVVKAYAIR